MADTKTQDPVHTSQPPNAPGPKPGTPERPAETPPVKPQVPK